ncbi:Ankyrin Repeat Domain-Containing Protein 26 [Manis pentadactyla]|nr:Ankyrin Repeat Domain-Containing Protein 26 [Manis pentadactyla]
MIPILSKQTLRNRMETYFFKIRKNWKKNITRELKEAAAKFESESCIAAPLGSTNGSTATQENRVSTLFKRLLCEDKVLVIVLFFYIHYITGAQ